MKQWWMWFLQSGIWILVTIFNILDKRSSVLIGWNILAVILFTLLGVIQYVCDKKGEKGKRVFKKICIGAIVIIVIVFLLILIAHYCAI